MSKQRLSASVDTDLIDAAERAVAEGVAETVSAWINAAMRRQLDHDARIRGLREFVQAYEAKHGAITSEEIEEATRSARATAVVVRPRAQRTKPAKKAAHRRARTRSA